VGEEKDRRKRRVRTGQSIEQAVVGDHLTPQRGMEARVRSLEERVKGQEGLRILDDSFGARNGADADRFAEVGRGEIDVDRRCGGKIHRGGRIRCRPDYHGPDHNDSDEQHQHRQQCQKSSFHPFHIASPSTLLSLSLSPGAEKIRNEFFRGMANSRFGQ
jgi:hypothetical protein